MHSSCWQVFLTMTEAQFNQIVDELMFSIEESIDDSGADIDYENTAGM